MLLRAAILLGVFAVLAPPAASGADVRLVTREEPLTGSRFLKAGPHVLPPKLAPGVFNLLGVHWRGEGDVWFRTSTDGRTWSAWYPAMPEAEDRPDPRTSEDGRRPGWKLGNPWWTGSSRFVQYRVDGTVTRLRAHFVWSQLSSKRELSAISSPEIVPRSGWEADESIVGGTPSSVPRLERAIVHHTAGRNDYGPEESAAVVRAIQEYHVKANRWNDIGYNFLVDRFGTVFEGRAGGIERNVVGAHARGFNAGSVGVAILGSYGNEPVSPEAETALVGLLAWRLDAGHIDPLGVSPTGLRAISGHRDVNDTACPGDALYGRLPTIAQTVALLGLPKLYEPAASPGKLVPLQDGTNTPVVFTARFSAALPWTVTVTEAQTGAPIASASGFGESVAWTWDGNGPSGAPANPAFEYVATFASSADVRSASLVLGKAGAAPARLEVTALVVSPQTLTPNGDGSGESARISFDLATAARVRVRLEDEIGARVATIVPERAVETGSTEVAWDGRTEAGVPVPDGRYRVVVLASKDGVTVSAAAALVLDRTLAALDVSPGRFSPNEDGRQDAVGVSFELTREAETLATVRAAGTVVATVVAGTLPAGAQLLLWTGVDGGVALPDGRYLVVVEATTDLGTRRLARTVIVDTHPPELTVRSVSIRDGSTRVRLSLTEQARVRAWVAGGARVADLRPGVRTMIVSGTGPRVRLRAWDLAGNASRLVSARAP